MKKKLMLVTAVLVAVTFYGCEKVSDDDGGQGPGKKSKGPFAEFSFVISSTQPNTVKFTNVSTDAKSFSWNFGDNTTSSLVAPEHTYSSSDDFTVSLTASDDNGESDTRTKVVTIEPF